jgi:hypothetical protein
MSNTQDNGMMDYWNTGLLRDADSGAVQFSIIPFFQHSNIPWRLL